jgi:DNA-binding winged helix-turn-helix (wHTH) protein
VHGSRSCSGAPAVPVAADVPPPRYRPGCRGGISPVSVLLTSPRVPLTIRSVEIELLGPLQVDGDGASFSPRDRVVLAALAVRPGEVVPAGRLADALWGEMPPASWAKVVQGCVLRVRKVLGPSAVETSPGGYRLVVGGDDVDVHRFEDLIERGRALAATGEPERAASACPDLPALPEAPGLLEPTG